MGKQRMTAGQLAEIEFREFFARVLRRHAKSGDHADVEAVMEVASAAIVAASSIIGNMCCANRAVAERSVLAYARGAVRGLGEPVHEDGRPFTGRLDA